MWISYRVCPQNAEMAALGIDKFLTSNINKSKREMSLKATSKHCQKNGWLWVNHEQCWIFLEEKPNSYWSQKKRYDFQGVLDQVLSLIRWLGVSKTTQRNRKGCRGPAGDGAQERWLHIIALFPLHTSSPPSVYYVQDCKHSLHLKRCLACINRKHSLK